MVKIITFEGTDYSGKSATIHQMAQTYKRPGIVFNEGPVYPTGLTARMLMAASQSNEQEREFIYTMIFVLDSTEAAVRDADDRVILQDRYWPSVLAYGRFLNREHSIHNAKDFRPLFIPPLATIHFSCSREEKIRRSKERNRKSVIDNILLENPAECARLEAETARSLEGLPNILNVDTTNLRLAEVTCRISDYLRGLGVSPFTET